MIKYYLVPVTSRNIKIRDLSLFELLESIDNELADRENTRINLTYEREDCYMLEKSGYINSYNENTSNLYRERRIPESLILKDDSTKVTEFFTGTEVDYDNKSELDMYRVKADVIQDFLTNNFDYQYKVEKFINNSKRNVKSFLKRKNSVKRGK